MSYVHQQQSDDDGAHVTAVYLKIAKTVKRSLSENAFLKNPWKHTKNKPLLSLARCLNRH